MTTPLITSLPLELTLNLTAAAERISAGMSDTGAVEYVIDDIAIEAVLYDTWAPLTATEQLNLAGGSAPCRRIATHDLLANVDTSNPHVQTFLSNILECVRKEAEEAFVEECDDE